MASFFVSIVFLALYRKRYSIFGPYKEVLKGLISISIFLGIRFIGNYTNLKLPWCSVDGEHLRRFEIFSISGFHNNNNNNNHDDDDEEEDNDDDNNYITLS